MNFRSLAIGVALLGSGVCAHANQIYTLSGVTLSTSASGGSPVGTLSGTFTTNDARSAVLSFDITASAAGSFTGFEYTNSDATVSASVLPSQYFQLDSLGNVDELRLYFTNGLSATGGTLSPVYSYESEPSGGNRFPTGAVVAGSVSSVTPEPASFALLGTGLLGMAGVVRRRLV